MTTEADLAAMLDVLRDVSEESDSTPFEEAARKRLALQAVISEARAALGLLETQMMNYLEDAPRRFDGASYEVVNDGVWRADHEVIHDRVLTQARREAVNPETGEVNVQRAMENVWSYVERLYLSPSTTAKVGGLRDLGFDPKNKEARRFESKGKKLVVTPLNAGEG